jgi:N-acylneuraminate cytidylyltransferase
MIVGLVCARSGSEGLPGKNFRDMCGKPLIEWTLDVALECPSIDYAVLVTDNREYLEAIGLDVIEGRRVMHLSLPEPVELAGPRVAKWNVWRWAVDQLNWLPQQIGTVVDLDVTRPIRTPEDVEKVIKRYYAPPPDSHVTMGVTQARKSPYFDLLEHDAHGALRLSKPHQFTVRQAAMPVWEHAGVYVVNRAALESYDGLFSEGLIVHGSYLPAECGLDIDDELDWTMVEAVMRNRLVEA